MIEINLIPDVKLQLIKAQQQRRTVISVSIIVAIVFAGLVAALAFYVFGVQTIAKNLVDGTIKSESKKLLAVEDLSKTLTIQAQLETVSKQHNDKLVNSRIFDILSTTVPEGENSVAVSSLSVDSEENIIMIEGEAANGYEALEVFKKTIAQTKFQYSLNNDPQDAINIATTIADGDRRYGEDSKGNRVLRFAMSFSFPDELLSPSSENGRIVAPNRQNATDSTNGVPNSLFTNGAPREEETE